MTDELNEFITLYVEVLAAFKVLGSPKTCTLKNLAAKYHRTAGAIRSRLEKLGVIRF